MLTRRRFIRITAATTAGALLPLAHAQTAAPAVKPTLWQGVALGSGAELRLYHPNPAVAQSLIKRSLDEVARLEKVFSLYRDDSQIQQLNRTGSLKNPPPRRQTEPYVFPSFFSFLRFAHRFLRHLFKFAVGQPYINQRNHKRKHNHKHPHPDAPSGDAV